MLSKDLFLFLELNGESLCLPACLSMNVLIVGGCHGEKEDKDTHKDTHQRSQNLFLKGPHSKHLEATGPVTMTRHCRCSVNAPIDDTYVNGHAMGHKTFFIDPGI